MSFSAFTFSDFMLSPSDRVLVAVSGGVDSMVLSHMLQTDYSIGLAHINHKMRKEESDEDAAFVQQYALKHDLPFYSIDLPDNFADTGNFQSEARKFRYEWLETIRKQHGFAKIATAHHQDDVVESLLINILRSSGIDGFTGIKHQLGDYIIRPLLSISKNDIIAYAHAHDVRFRQDSSNASSKYLRNKVRNELLPAIESIFPQFKYGLLNSAKHLGESNVVLDFLIKENNLVTKREDELSIDLRRLTQSQDSASLLYHMVKRFGFNKMQCIDLLQNSHSGNKIESTNYKIIFERTHLRLKKKGSKSQEIYLEITKEGNYQIGNKAIAVKIIPIDHMTHKYSVEYFGFDYYPFPFTIRSKKEGDRFFPLGMKNKSKSLKKFFIDIKLTSSQKEEVLVFEKDAKIFYVLPHRIDDRFKVEKDKKFILLIEIIEDPVIEFESNF